MVTAETGILVPAGHVEALAHGLATLAGDADARARMGRRARRHGEGPLFAERLVGDIDSLYQELIRERRRDMLAGTAPATPRPTARIV